MVTTGTTINMTPYVSQRNFMHSQVQIDQFNFMNSTQETRKRNGKSTKFNSTYSNIMSNAFQLADKSPCIVTPQEPMRQLSEKPHVVVHDDTLHSDFRTNFSDLLGRTFKEKNEASSTQKLKLQNFKMVKNSQ